ncbi:MAG: type IV pilin protein [Luteimonas sp.]
MLTAGGKERGFTLIELMVVVAIVAILVGIALPAYQDSIRKARRGQAKADLVELAQRAERYHTENNRYDADATVPTNGFWVDRVPNGDRNSPRTGAAFYVITEVEAANTFTLTATPQGSQTADALCGTLSVDSAGVKLASADPGNTNRCW